MVPQAYQVNSVEKEKKKKTQRGKSTYEGGRRVVHSFKSNKNGESRLGGGLEGIDLHKVIRLGL